MHSELSSEKNIYISIIVPVYNVEMYLRDCLDSILNQDYSDYEIICVNDASTDNSREILCEYAVKYSKIRIITHLENKGLSAARNTGIANAKGKYLLFVDSDDIIISSTLVELYQLTQKKQVDIVYFDMDVIYQDAYKKMSKNDEERINSGEIFSGRELFCIFAEKGQKKSEVCRQFIKRDFLKEQRIEFYDGILHEDELFSFLCAMSALKVVNLNRKYYIYRQRLGSIMSRRNNKRAESVFVILVQILTFWASHTFTDRENEAIRYYFGDLYNTYRYYSCFEEGKEYLEVGGFVEKALYTILQTAHTSRYLTLNKEQLSCIEKARHIIVFGAGKAAMDIVNILRRKNIHIDAIAVSNSDDNSETFCGIQVRPMDSIAYYLKDALVIIGVTEKYSQGIQDRLEKLGCKDIIIPLKVVN